MSDNELLLAISNIVGSHIEPLKNDVAIIKEKINILEEDVSELKRDVSVLKEEVSVLKDDVSVLKNEVFVLKDKVLVLEDKVSVLNEKVQRIEVTLENNVLPRLQNIESCYTSTYYRYASGIDQLDAMQSDIDVMKIVVTEHSKKFEKLA